MTGGYASPNRVSYYSEDGYLRDLPQLLRGRWDHGCSYFENDEGTKVDVDSNSCGLIIFQTFLVTGGLGFDYLTSTELLVENSAKWIYSGELPTLRWGLSGANIDQRVIMTGNKYITVIVIKELSDKFLHLQEDILEPTSMMRSWNSSPVQESGAWLVR